MADKEGKSEPPFDRATVAGRRAEMAYLDQMSDEERASYDPGHCYVHANAATSAEREALLAAQLADVNSTIADA